MPVDLCKRIIDLAYLALVYGKWKTVDRSVPLTNRMNLSGKERAGETKRG